MKLLLTLMCVLMLSACASATRAPKPSQSRIVTGQALINNMLATCASIATIGEGKQKGSYQRIYTGCIADSKVMFKKYLGN